MRILLAVHQFFPMHYTGTERLVLDLATQLQRMGHYVKVLTYAILDSEGFSAREGLMVKEYEFEGVPVVSIRHKDIPSEIGFALSDPIAERALRIILASEDIDILHVCHPMRLAPVIGVAKEMRIPVVLTLTDFWVMCPKGIAVTGAGDLCKSNGNGHRCVSECYGPVLEDRLVARAAAGREMLASVDRVVSGTDFLRRLFIAEGYATNVMHIRFGTDYRNVRRNSRGYTAESMITVGFLSTLQPHKGAHVLIDAYQRAMQPNIRIQIYGDHFDQEDYYSSLKKRVIGTPNIELRGKYEPDELTNILDELDLVVVPSVWWENSPLVLLRALAHNIPAIVANLGGMTEVVRDGVDGFVFEAGSPDSLAAVLQKIGRDPALLNNLKARIEYPPRLEEEAFEYERLYLELLTSSC